jgi:two-component system, chemotaxis family, chemotaxis protein CheY
MNRFTAAQSENALIIHRFLTGSCGPEIALELAPALEPAPPLAAMIGLAGRVMQSNTNNIEAVIRSAKVLIVDDEFYMRKVIRTLLLSVGVTDVHDTPDGASGLAAISVLDPDVVILDWQMDGMNGPEFVRRVRAPDQFAYPNVPIIMLTGHSEHSRVVEAMRLGVHEFLVKPVSSKALNERLASVLLHPRPMVRRGDHYGPAPRKLPRGAANFPSPEPQSSPMRE